VEGNRAELLAINDIQQLSPVIVTTQPPTVTVEIAREVHPIEKTLVFDKVPDKNKNAPRTFDVDIILFDGLLLDQNLWSYVHRAVPVAEILPDYRSDQGKLLKEVARELTETNPIRLKRDVPVDSQS
jgi:7,8-dihydro-6-hydroxymethylpterin-pyrophosphokinase